MGGVHATVHSRHSYYVLIYQTILFCFAILLASRIAFAGCFAFIGRVEIAFVFAKQTREPSNVWPAAGLPEPASAGRPSKLKLSIQFERPARVGLLIAQVILAYYTHLPGMDSCSRAPCMPQKLPVRYLHTLVDLGMHWHWYHICEQCTSVHRKTVKCFMLYYVQLKWRIDDIHLIWFNLFFCQEWLIQVISTTSAKGPRDTLQLHVNAAPVSKL